MHKQTTFFRPDWWDPEIEAADGVDLGSSKSFGKGKGSKGKGKEEEEIPQLHRPQAELLTQPG